MRAAMDLASVGNVCHPENYREGDRLFHVEIARASGNPAYEVVVSKLWEYRTKPLFERFERLLFRPDRPGRTAASIRGSWRRSPPAMRQPPESR